MVIEHHPELEREQEHIRRAYDRLRAMRARVLGYRNLASEQLERMAWDRWRDARVAELSDDRSSLVFGRIDDRQGERYYIGRRHVEGPDGEVTVVDWRAPVSVPFYRAGAREPMGLALRRHFLVEGEHLLGIADELFDGTGDGEERSLELLRAALERRRGGEMRDIVATIQAEQDVIIRAPLNGVVVVQGGPGTGKTAVGLHRAAFLLFEHRPVLERAGVLVVGPNRIFIRYVSQVLPSLGETAIDQRPVSALGPTLATRDDADAGAERIKGDARMAEVVRRAVWSLARAPDEDLTAALNTIPMRLAAREVRALMEPELDPQTPFNVARERFLRKVMRELFAQYEGPVPSTMTIEQFTAALRQDRALVRALDRVWPRATATSIVSGLVRSAQKLAAAAQNVLSPDEQRTIVRAARRFGRGWSPADRVLVDEARAVADGTGEDFGHVIVDEAQDLSPMQLRMIARRCAAGSMTVLGDLAQATGTWSHRTWESVLAHLPTDEGARVEELTLGYRVADEVMAVAERLLSAIAPELRAPAAVRRGGTVTYAAVPSDRLAAEVAARAGRMASRDGAFAVIAPDSLLDATGAALGDAGVLFGDARQEALDRPVTLLPARACKGLEFDGVVLMEPTTILDEEGDAGMRRLYVCVTRAMRDLVIAHARPIPDALRAPEAVAS